jgi:gamma-aminobutyric acid receptor subunit alpha
MTCLWPQWEGTHAYPPPRIKNKSNISPSAIHLFAYSILCLNVWAQTANVVFSGLKCWNLSKFCIPQDPLNCGISTSSPPSHQQQQQATCHHHHVTCVTRQTQTEHRVPKWRQLLYCLAGDDAYRRQRQREAAHGSRIAGEGGLVSRHVNSVSYIDQAARVLFPASFGLLNLFYWVAYYTYQEEFGWGDPPITPFGH